ncbi:MAG TPA: TMEM175 family protein [Gemmatimonadaceae bacterium]|nr:TMEM175 family protein [Gemmatimonadaceae bacterium]
MIRNSLIEHYERAGRAKNFRNREISRLEGLSDAVFGFAITLLIVSLEVPKTSGELIETMRGFIAFAFTFFILFTIWHRQFQYFRRYGLEDTVAVALNAALLFVVLFFVYPLKFLATYLVGRAMGGSRMVTLDNGATERIVNPEHFPWLFGIYGLGFAAVFAVFALLYRHALSKRTELGLNEVEVFETRHSVKLYSVIAALGVLIGLSGWASIFERRGGAWASISWLFVVADLVGVVILFRLRLRARGQRHALETLTPFPSAPIEIKQTN